MSEAFVWHGCATLLFAGNLQAGNAREGGENCRAFSCELVQRTLRQ